MLGCILTPDALPNHGFPYPYDKKQEIPYTYTPYDVPRTNKTHTAKQSAPQIIKHHHRNLRSTDDRTMCPLNTKKKQGPLQPPCPGRNARRAARCCTSSRRTWTARHGWRRGVLAPCEPRSGIAGAAHVPLSPRGKVRERSIRLVICRNPRYHSCRQVRKGVVSLSGLSKPEGYSLISGERRVGGKKTPC